MLGLSGLLLPRGCGLAAIRSRAPVVLRRTLSAGRCVPILALRRARRPIVCGRGARLLVAVVGSATVALVPVRAVAPSLMRARVVAAHRWPRASAATTPALGRGHVLVARRLADPGHGRA